MQHERNVRITPTDGCLFVGVGHSGYYGPDTETEGQPQKVVPEQLAARLAWIGVSPDEIARAIGEVNEGKPALIHKITPSREYLRWEEQPSRP